MMGKSLDSIKQKTKKQSLLNRISPARGALAEGRDEAMVKDAKDL